MNQISAWNNPLGFDLSLKKISKAKIIQTTVKKQTKVKKYNNKGTVICNMIIFLRNDNSWILEKNLRNFIQCPIVVVKYKIHMQL